MYYKEMQELKVLAITFKDANVDKQTVLFSLGQIAKSRSLEVSDEDLELIVEEVFCVNKKSYYPYNDLGNKECFIDMYGDELRFHADGGVWLCWDGAHWKVDSHGVMAQQCAEKSVQSMLDEEGSVIMAQELQKHYKASASRARINAFMSLAQKDERLYVSTDMLDADQMLLCCQSGTIDLRTGKLREYSKKDMITKMCGAIYDPNCKFPRFMKFLNEITCKDQDLIDYLQKVIGYSLSGLVKEQEIYFLVGEGANGKSTLIDILTALMGDYLKLTRAQTFERTKNRGVENDIAALCGARMVVASELDQGMVFSDATIKKLTGDEKVTARYLFKEFFDYVITYKIFILANHKPIIKDTTHAMWRRIRVIPFDYIVPEEKIDPFLKEKIISDELPGILAWAVKGFLKYQQEGLKPPQAVLIASEKFCKECNQLARFVEECCVIDKNASTYNKVLRKYYADWCHQMSHETISQGAFSECLAAMGIWSKRDGKNGETVWHGVALKMFWEDDEDGEENTQTDDHATDHAGCECNTESV